MQIEKYLSAQIECFAFGRSERRQQVLDAILSIEDLQFHNKFFSSHQPVPRLFVFFMGNLDEISLSELCSHNEILGSLNIETLLYWDSDERLGDAAKSLFKELGLTNIFTRGQNLEVIVSFLREFCLSAKMIGGYYFYQSILQELTVKGDVSEIENLLEKIQDTEFSGNQGNYLMYACCVALENPSLQKYYLRRVLAYNSQDTFAANRLAKVLLELGKVSESLEIFNKLDEVGGSNYHRYLVHAKLLLGLWDVDGAFAFMERYRQTAFEPSGETEALMGIILCLRGEFDKAAELVGKNRATPETWAMFNKAAVLAGSRDEWKQAVSVLTAAQEKIGLIQTRVAYAIFWNLAISFCRIEAFSSAKTTLESWLKIATEAQSQEISGLMKSLASVTSKSKASSLKPFQFKAI